MYLLAKGLQGACRALAGCLHDLCMLLAYVVAETSTMFLAFCHAQNQHKLPMDLHYLASRPALRELREAKFAKGTGRGLGGDCTACKAPAGHERFLEPKWHHPLQPIPNSYPYQTVLE